MLRFLLLLAAEPALHDVATFVRFVRCGGQFGCFAAFVVTTDLAAPFFPAQALYARPLSHKAFVKSGEFYDNDPATAVSSEAVGWKAFGLSCLPSGWAPDYLVVNSEAARRAACS